MRTSEAAAVYPVGRSLGGRKETYSLRDWIKRLTPSEGWDTFALMLAATSVVAWTVREANWVETPGLFFVIFLGLLTGLVLAKIRAPWPLLHLAALGLGLFVVIWQTASLLPDLSTLDAMREVWDRTAAWFVVAREGGINTDLLPATLYLLGLAWLLGYVSAWPLFRYTNVWIALLIGAMAILTTLSFLPEKFALRFFLFLFLAMLLAARTNVIHHRKIWRANNIQSLPSGSTRWFTTTAIVLLCGIVLATASGLPLNVYVSKTVVKLWNKGRSPIARFDDDFARMFSGITSKKDVKGRYFGSTLPFQGKISFGGEVVMWASSRDPAYWLSRTYSKYTSEGWIAGETTIQDIGPEGLPPPPHESGKRELAFQQVQLTFNTDELFTGGNVDWVSHDALVETLKPPVFKIDLKDPSNNSNLPPDVQDLAEEWTHSLNPPPNKFVESYITSVLPEHLTLVEASPGGDTDNWTSQDSVTLVRKEPDIPDVTDWRLANRLEANETYSLYSFVSNATNRELQEAGDDYHPFITDQYLQLPASLPQRVRDLTDLITEQAGNPLDKALAIQAYLRDETRFTYSQDIKRPPLDSDGVDHFLFKSTAGYSDYFASAMTVMLRAVGVPARMAAGYAPGEQTIFTGRRAIKDSDSHGWTQVYFPGYGWIDFEPTPNWPAIERGEIPSALAETPVESEPLDLDPQSLSQIEDQGIECEDGLFYDDIDDPSECPEFGTNPLGDEVLEGSTWNPISVGAPLAIVLVVIAAGWLAGWLVWTRGLRNATPAEKVYTKMGRLGTVAGLGRRSQQTPIEYAAFVGTAIPAIATDTRTVAWSFAVDRYSQQTSEDDQGTLNDIWKRIRGGLLIRLLRRLVPIGEGTDYSKRP